MQRTGSRQPVALVLNAYDSEVVAHEVCAILEESGYLTQRVLDHYVPSLRLGTRCLLSWNLQLHQDIFLYLIGPADDIQTVGLVELVVGNCLLQLVIVFIMFLFTISTHHSHLLTRFGEKQVSRWPDSSDVQMCWVCDRLPGTCHLATCACDWPARRHVSWRLLRWPASWSRSPARRARCKKPTYCVLLYELCRAAHNSATRQVSTTWSRHPAYKRNELIGRTLYTPKLETGTAWTSRNPSAHLVRLILSSFRYRYRYSTWSSSYSMYHNVNISLT